MRRDAGVVLATCLVAGVAAVASIATLVVVLEPGAARADAPAGPAEESRRLGYSIGYQVGSDFRRQAVAITPEWVARGVEDALAGAEPLLTSEQMRELLSTLKRRTDGGG